MTCPHNFAAWDHTVLARLATDQYMQIKELQEIITAYKAHIETVEAQRKLLHSAWRVEVSK